MKKITPIIQMNQTECGLCVAIMLMEYYGVILNVHDITIKFPTGRDGSNLEDLKNIFSYYNFQTKTYKVKGALSEITNPVLPCIGYKKKGHFVVIENIKGEKVTILDPVIGRTIISKNELDTEFEKIIIRILPTDNFEKINTRKNEFSLIKEALTFNKVVVFKVLIVTFIIYMLTLLIPILLKNIVDIFLSSSQVNNQIAFLSIAILVSSLFYLLINKLKLVFSIDLSISVDKFLSYKVMDKLFNNKFEFFLNRTSSDIQYRLALLKGLNIIISKVVIQTFLDAGLMFVIFVYVFSINFVYALLVFLFTIIILTISMVLRNNMLMHKNSELAADNKLQVLQYDIFRSIFDVKVLSLSNTKHKIWNTYYDKYLIAHKKNQIFLSIYQNIISYVSLFCPILIPLIGIWINGTVNKNQLGIIISLQAVTGIYIGSLISVSQLSDNITSLKSYVTRIQDILLQESEIERSQTIDFKGNINVENLSFVYPGSKNKVLNNVSFSLKEGESLAIVGESGSGKTTLFYILLGAYDKYEGQIEFENVNLQKINKDDLRNQIGVVPQNPLLFSGSIKDNITQYKKHSDKHIYDVLKKVSLYNFIQSLPMKLDTIVSENGFNLSGGQKQRISIAQAIINKKSVLFLDEATSSLDNIIENNISQHLSKEYRTKIVIAHRLTTIKKSDKIIVMKKGEVVEIGNHEQLLEKKGEYYKMYSD
ncbi:peptidase domain-containing ABC transporter [Lactococcus lactis]|uniref:peptidase domain-containing ABC transporter n=1 Tax=Lactococcus lactis TaxID=1358 RepID=UPI000728FC7F|nr:peptidase domain-containing ABC transporter [Lactococcus lactis]KST94216.1 Lipid A export ATP-binding/permease protein MsbA [Lactococcus lactis subsp. lactis]